MYTVLTISSTNYTFDVYNNAGVVIISNTFLIANCRLVRSEHSYNILESDEPNYAFPPVASYPTNNLFIFKT